MYDHACRFLLVTAVKDQVESDTQWTLDNDAHTALHLLWLKSGIEYCYLRIALEEQVASTLALRLRQIAGRSPTGTTPFVPIIPTPMWDLVWDVLDRVRDGSDSAVIAAMFREELTRRIGSGDFHAYSSEYLATIGEYLKGGAA